MSNTISKVYLNELNAEYRATRACLERIPETLFEYKPHPTSMNLGYLALLIAEIPLWITHMITEHEIDLGTFKHIKPTTTKELVDHFEENMAAARKALELLDDEGLRKPFSLKSNGQSLYSAPLMVDIGTTINHWVHHRGQLTVYMRMKEIPVPSIYGPSADDKNFVVPK